MKAFRFLTAVVIIATFVPVYASPEASSYLPDLPGWTVESDQADANLGRSLNFAGDVNNDGYDDVIVGAPYYSNGHNQEGAAFVYLGSASGLSTTSIWSYEGNQTEAHYGTSVAAAGDVNNDGYDDIIVGTPNYDGGVTDEGRAQLFYGNGSGVNAGPAWTTEANWQYFAWGGSVASAGDVNNDGYDDVLVGVPGYTVFGSPNRTNAGAVYVFHGSGTGLSTTENLKIIGPVAYAGFGGWVSTAGDVNNDDFDDILFGAPSYSSGQQSEGRAYVHHGSGSGVNASYAWVTEGNFQYMNYGTTVSTAGDVNNDGYDDVIVGAPFYDAPASFNEGAAYLYLGSSTGLDTTSDWSVIHSQSNAMFGYVSAARDVNGDGYDDFLVGAPNFAHGQDYEGVVYLYYGGDPGPDTTDDWHYESDQSYANLGTAVSGGGDADNDGLPDILVGVPYYSNGESSEGRAYGFYGAQEDIEEDVYLPFIVR